MTTRANDVDFRNLGEEHEETVKHWLRIHLRRHIGWWVASLGPAWALERIDQHIDEKDLIDQDWREMLADGERADHFSTVVHKNDKPVGMVHGGVRIDRYLLGKKGFLGWIVVDEGQRGEGIGRLLMEWVDCWFRAEGTELHELFVTQENEQAIGLYEAFGYRSVDVRMLRA